MRVPHESLRVSPIQHGHKHVARQYCHQNNTLPMREMRLKMTKLLVAGCVIYELLAAFNAAICIICWGVNLIAAYNLKPQP
jgi:hypothetical protein